MNCNQARAMLAAYRELKNGEVDTLELDVHLEGCASCRQELARYMLIGEQVRSLPVIEPLPDMHVTLMHAIAKVQLEFIRRSAPGTVITPEFLKPYIQEHVQSSHDSDLITAFSTAETGPLPIIQAKRKPRHRSHMSQFAVLGLAAMFLIVLMMGGLTSLLMLAHNNVQPNSIAVRVEHIEVIPAQYTTSTPYPHVVSAVSDDANIYYTAYGDGTNNSWMLEMLNRKTKISIPLLPTPNANTLIVLGSSASGVVWLQFDGYKLNPHQKNLPGYSQHPPASLQWSLHYLSSEQLQQIVSGLYTPSEVLLTGTFNQDAAPPWVTTPVQGIWFINESHQASLLVASIDGNGISHLTSYQLAAELGTVGTPATEIATATAGHILTSPTATSDGTQIYWSEEWFSTAGVLSSDIWTQQVVDAAGPSHGRWAGHLQKMIVKERFTSDGISFRPQVVDNTLLTLCTASLAVCTASQADATQGTPTTTGTGTATSTPTPTPSPNTSAIPQTVANIYAPPLDASVRGTILKLPLDGNPLELPTTVNTTGLASSLQAGADFALWQGDRGYEMYDVSQGSDVNIGNTLDNATFVAVNGASAVWMVSSTTSNTTGKTGPSVTLMAFNWPK